MRAAARGEPEEHEESEIATRPRGDRSGTAALGHPAIVLRAFAVHRRLQERRRAVMGSQLLQQLRARQSKPTPSAEDEGRALLAAHSSEEACWVLLELDGKLRVLDVTAYLGHHPGGAKIIHRLAGTDITRPFTDVYKHSPAAYLKCRDYEIASDISDV